MTHANSLFGEVGKGLHCISLLLSENLSLKFIISIPQPATNSHVSPTDYQSSEWENEAKSHFHDGTIPKVFKRSRDAVAHRHVEH